LGHQRMVGRPAPRGPRNLRSAESLSPQAEQPQYSLLERRKFEQDTLAAVQKLGMGTVVWSPLASGLLTGKYDEGVPPDSRLGQIDWLRDAVIRPERIQKVKKMKAVAQELG